MVQPEIAQRAHRQVMTERTRQHGAVDAAGRGAGDDIDDDAQLERLADIPKQLKIDFVRVVLGIVAVKLVKEVCRRSLGTVHDAVQGAGRANQLQNLLADSIHVDRKRNASEADQCYSEFLLFQRFLSFRAGSPLVATRVAENLSIDNTDIGQLKKNKHKSNRPVDGHQRMIPVNYAALRSCHGEPAGPLPADGNPDGTKVPVQHLGWLILGAFQGGKGV